MNINQTLQEAKRHLINGDFEMAIHLLGEKANPSYKRKLEILSFRLNQIKDKKTDGLITNEQEKADLNQLASDFLELIQAFNTLQNNDQQKALFLRPNILFLGFFFFILIGYGIYSSFYTQQVRDQVMSEEELMADFRKLHASETEIEIKEELISDILPRFAPFTKVIIFGKNRTLLGESELSYFLDELSHQIHEGFQIESLKEDEIIIRFK